MSEERIYRWYDFVPILGGIPAGFRLGAVKARNPELYERRYANYSANLYAGHLIAWSAGMVGGFYTIIFNHSEIKPTTAIVAAGIAVALGVGSYVAKTLEERITH